MKTLVIVRHAKSAWDNPHLTDRDRVLNERGMRDAPRMAAYVADTVVLPQIVLSSTAVRAWSTAQEFIAACGIDEAYVRRDARIYDASLATLLTVIGEIDNGIQSAMIVGHNPGVTELVRYVADATFAHMPTCGVAVIECAHAETWQEIARGTGVLTHFLFPKGIGE